MGKPEKIVTQKQPEPEPHHGELKGTFTSVMLLGVLIIVCWIGVWLLFISR